MGDGGERHGYGRVGGIGGVGNPDKTMSSEDDNAGLEVREGLKFIALDVNGGED